MSSSHADSTDFPDSHPILLYLAGLQPCIQCVYKGDVRKSLLVSQHWSVHV